MQLLKDIGKFNCQIVFVHPLLGVVPCLLMGFKPLLTLTILNPPQAKPPCRYMRVGTGGAAYKLCPVQDVFWLLLVEPTFPFPLFSLDVIVSVRSNNANYQTVFQMASKLCLERVRMTLHLIC